MAKGDYKSKFGGSRSGYEKGVYDTLKVIGISILSVASIVFTAIITKKK